MENTEISTIVIDETTCLCINGVQAAQLPAVVNPYSKIIKEFDLIIEIGYHRGGFTLWLEKNKNVNAKVIGYDINDSERIANNPNTDNVDLRIGNCFDSTIINEITSLITSSNKAMILCDGGHKEQEFNQYAPFLRSGDVILIHDYYDDRKPEPYNSFAESASCNWRVGPESIYSHIKQTIEDNSLDEHMYYEEFRRCITGAFIKR